MDKIAEQYIEAGRLMALGFEDQLDSRGLLEKEAAPTAGRTVGHKLKRMGQRAGLIPGKVRRYAGEAKRQAKAIPGRYRSNLNINDRGLRGAMRAGRQAVRTNARGAGAIGLGAAGAGAGAAGTGYGIHQAVNKEGAATKGRSVGHKLKRMGQKAGLIPGKVKRYAGEAKRQAKAIPGRYKSNLNINDRGVGGAMRAGRQAIRTNARGAAAVGAGAAGTAGAAGAAGYAANKKYKNSKEASQNYFLS